MREKLLTLLDVTDQGVTVTGAAVACGLAKRMTITCGVYNCDTDAGDTCDVTVETSLDGASWIEVAHFEQKIGTDSDSVQVAVLDPVTPGSSTFDVTAALAAGSTRPAIIGNFVRGKATIVDDGTVNASFDVELLALLKE